MTAQRSTSPRTWSRARTIDADVDASAVWRLWADLRARPRWKDLRWVEFDQPLEVGASGRWKPPVVPPMRFHVVEVEPGRSLVLTATHAPSLAVGRIEHHVEPLGTGRCRITHRVVLEGPHAQAVGRLFGRGLASETSLKRMRKLVELAGRA